MSFLDWSIWLPLWLILESFVKPLIIGSFLMFWSLPIVWPITLHVMGFLFIPFWDLFSSSIFQPWWAWSTPTIYISNWDWNSIISYYNFKLYVILLNDSIRLLKGGETNYYLVLTPCIIKEEKKKNPFLGYWRLDYVDVVFSKKKKNLCQCSHLNFWNSSMAPKLTTNKNNWICSI